MTSRVLAVSLFLLVSGFAALVFQTAWLREFRLIFGASTPASAAVLAIFMGGLGLGNAVLGRRVDRSPNPLRLYAMFELGISAACVASPFLIELVRGIYFSLGGQEALGISGATIVRLLLSTLVLGVPTFLMGGTLPAAARAATAAGDQARSSVGWLYGLNTIGAVLGALAGTFVLLERLGNRETLWAVSAINIANALLAWRLAGRWPALPEARPAKVNQPQVADDERPPAWLTYSAAGLVGFAFLLMEIVWYRMLGPILGGTTFTFGIILAVALAGIGIGGALYPLLFRQRLPTLRDLALTCGWEALALAVPLALGDRLAILAAVLRGLEYFGFGGQVAAWIAIAALVILPAALISGLQFPLLIALLGRGSRDVGRQVGQATAWNTIGAMAGSLAGGFGLLPLLTAPGAWRLVVLLLGVLSLVLSLHSVRRRSLVRLVHPALVILLAALCLQAAGPTAVWRHSGIGAGRARMPETTHNALRQWTNATRSSIIWEADGQESSVAVSAMNGAAFLVNGKSDGNAITDASTQIMFPMIGAIIHPHPKRSLVIGLGTGESAGWLATIPAMEQVEVVELEPAIANVAQLCAPLNHDVLHHPKVRTIFNDGREVLQTSRGQFDLIASEPSNPYRAGVANLYTREFYQSVRQRLAPRGLFMQWVQGYEIDAATFRTVVCTARSVFEHVEIWQSKPADLVLVCSAEPFAYDLDQLRSRVQEPAVREALRVGWRTGTVEGVLAHYVANEQFVNAVADQRLGWINSDNHNLLEFSFARTVGRNPGFSMEGLRAEALRMQAHRPLAVGPGVDWEVVEDRRIAFHAGVGDSPLPAGLFRGERASRAQALAVIATAADPAGAVTSWNQQSRPPEDLLEVAFLGLAYASTGDERARPLIDQVRATSPVEADALAGILAFEKQDDEQAARFLAAAFEKMRTDATGHPRILDAAMYRAAQIGPRDRRQAARLAEALSEPFAVFQQELGRRTTRWLIAQHVSDAAMLESLAELEPHVPWDLEFLKRRFDLYQRTKHPREARAARELSEFAAWMSEPYVLRPGN